MSYQGKLNLYIERVQQRLKLGASLRGAAMLTAAALVTTVVLVVILNAFGFPKHGLPGARVALIVLLAGTALVGLALPLLRLNRARSIETAETAHPEFQERLVTFHEREAAGSDPFIELLAKDTLSVAESAPSESLVPQNTLYAFAGVALACVGVLVWMVAAGPGYLGYGASLLWTGPKKNVAPLYDIRVAPGNIAVRRNSDQLITAQVIGLKTDKVQLFARFKSAKGWEPVAMQPQQNAAGTMDGRVSGGSFQFLFAGLPENVEYYVVAGPITSEHYQVRVVDLPAVKQIHVTYHYPKWTGMKEVSEEHGGDLRALEGTDAELEVQMDGPLRDGMLTLDDGKQIHLTGGEGNKYKGTIHMEKDGAYHVAATDEGQSVRLSEDYFIATNKANPPSIAIDRPGRDYRASPIEEVTIGVKAADDFGLNHMSLHYSVNGGPEKTVDLLKQPGAKDADGSVTLSLEDFKMVPGDLVSFYATAKDGHAEARTDITFIQADPFEREFSQSQQGGGGGGGGGGQGQGNQTDISRRQKELIAATWKQQNDKKATAKETADAGKFLSDVQNKLREQVLALSGRMQSRDLSTANEEFNSFEKDMQAAATAMMPSSDKLKQMQWSDAMSAEQKALQYLLRAEATFRQIQVAFGQQRGGGGGGGSAGRDLASLFDLELDTEKNQYETAQTGSAADEKAKQVDDALQKLDALARRQEELAQQQQKAPPTFQERWQQEMLRREAEQLQRQMEQMAQNGQQGQGEGASSGQGQSSSGQSSGQSSRQQSSQSSGQSQGQQQGQSQGQSSGQSQGRSGQSREQQRAGESGVDPRVQQALNRLREADEQMKRANGGQQGNGQQNGAQQGGAEQGSRQGGQQGGGQQAGGQSAEAARRAAEALRQATGLLSGTQQQQASSKVDSLSREADRLSKEEKAQAARIHGLETPPERGENEDPAAAQAKMSQRMQERDRLANDRQRLSDDLERLQSGMRDGARQMAPTQPGTASKLRDALGGMDQSDLTNLTQRTADWLRRGINPNSNGTEAQIGKGLDQLNDQLRQAQQGVGQGTGQGKDGQRQGASGGQETAELDHVERLRNQIESMTATGRNGQQQGRNGQQQGRGGQQGQNGQQGQGSQAGQQGQSGQGGQQGGQQAQNGRGGQQGQSAQQGQNGQQGQGGQQGQSGQSGQGGQGGQQAQNGRGGQQGGQQGQLSRNGGQGGRPGQPGQPGQVGSLDGQRNGGGDVNRGGDVGNRNSGGGYGGEVDYNIDTGDSHFRSGPRVIDGPKNTGQGAPSEEAYRAGMNELNQLRQLAGNDPETAKEVQDLIRTMQRLDPSRFPGNPEMVEQLHTEVMNGVDKLELQLRRDGAESGQVRTDKPLTVPPGYQDAVADYYRRLGKGQ